MINIGGWPISSYFFFAGLASALGYLLFLHYLKRDNESNSCPWPLWSGTFISSWIGAKLFFLFFSQKTSVGAALTSSSFWLGGGFVFYGGLAAGLAFAVAYCLLSKCFSARNLSLALPGLCFGQAIGRLGCFLTGCCFGSHCQLPWAISLHGISRHPVQLYEMTSLLILGSVLHILVRRGLVQRGLVQRGLIRRELIQREKEASLLFPLYLIGYATQRFLLEFFRGDQIRGVDGHGISTSQYLALLTIMGTLLYQFCHHYKQSKRSAI